MRFSLNDCERNSVIAPNIPVLLFVLFAGENDLKPETIGFLPSKNLHGPKCNKFAM